MTLEISLINSPEVVLVDEEDFDFISQWSWRLQSKKPKNRYASRNQKRPSGKWRTEFMHRVILNAPETFLVDHIDHDGLNNRRSNLRLANYSQNAIHARRAIGTCGYRGVRFRERYGTFFARIRVNKKEHYLGRFDNPIDAALAYDRAAVKLHGEFAVLNFPTTGEVRQMEFSFHDK